MSNPVIGDYGTRHWYRDGKRHRDDGLAIEWASGTKRWYRDGKLHRDDGPAVELANGTKYWYRDGELHRDDGPAIELADGNKHWYMHDKEYTFEDYCMQLRRLGYDEEHIDRLMAMQVLEAL